MKEIELLTCEWYAIPRDLRPDAIAFARDRAARLALTWTGHPDETTYIERGLSGASSSEVTRWAAKPLKVLRADFRVCHFFDACLRAQASFLRRKTPPKSAKKMVEWVKATRSRRDGCRDLLIDLHTGTPPFNLAGPEEREAMRKMMEAIKRENERAEMLLLAMAFYPAAGLEKQDAPAEAKGLELLPLPEGSVIREVAHAIGEDTL
jgi:hypothetical protein